MKPLNKYPYKNAKIWNDKNKEEKLINENNTKMMVLLKKNFVEREIKPQWNCKQENNIIIGTSIEEWEKRTHNEEVHH